MYRTFLLAFGITGLLAASSSATDVVRLEVTPRICQSPCFMRLRIRIEPHETNLALRVLVDGTMYRYSEIALGIKSPTLFLLNYPGLPAGNYTIVADLLRHDAGSRSAGRVEGKLEVME